MNLLVLIGVLVATAVGSWVVSGFDTKLPGLSKTDALIRRGIRCGITLVVMGFAADQFIRGGVVEGFIALIFVLPLVPFWIGCLSEVGARGVGGLVDSEDNRKFDPQQVPRDLNRLAEMARLGRYHEAIALSRQLRESSQVSTTAMEAMLFRLYKEAFSGRSPIPHLAEFQRLRDQARFAEAAIKLEELLKKQPQDFTAAFLLMRIYAQDLQRPALAMKILQSLGGDPSMPPSFAEYARQCINEWTGAVASSEKSTGNVESLLVGSQPGPVPAAVPEAGAPSVDAMLAAGQLATAIEVLENQTRMQPADFESWLKLAEAHGVYCGDLQRAGKIIDRIAANPAFSSEQIQLAKAKFKDWKAKRP